MKKTRSLLPKHILFVLQIIRQRPSDLPMIMKYYIPWRRSYSEGRSPLADAIPWMTFPAIEWLKRYLKKTMRVFEYGSGGSTLFFSSRVNELITVEHDVEWFGKVSKITKSCDIKKYRLLLCEPDLIDAIHDPMIFSQDPSDPDNYFSSVPKYIRFDFYRYVTTIEQYQDGCFDLVSIDGRARPSCIKHSINKVRPLGYLLLDNSDYLHYERAKSMLASWRRKDFNGLGPYARCWCTSIWQKPG